MGIIRIYTDGSCIDNRYGGWGVVIVNEDNIWCISDGCDNTTNNRMELTAVIEALTFMNEENNYEIYTDSQLTLNCATGKWKRKANLDLWKQFDDEYENRKVKWNWVKAHNGDKYNEMVDKLAYSEANKNKINKTNLE